MPCPPRRAWPILCGMSLRRFVMILAVAGLLGGCVERTITVTSDPPGALVLLSDEPKGRTPVTFSFLWYGDYEVILRMDGYDTLVTNAEISPPWYEIPPMDLFSALAPWTYHDDRFLHYTLTEHEAPTSEELINRAEELRQRNLEPVER